MTNRYRQEIIIVLAIKVVLIFMIKMVWFSDQPHIDSQVVAQQLLSPTADNGSKEHP